VLLEIETQDRQLAMDMLEGSEPSHTERAVDIPGKARLIVKRVGEGSGHRSPLTVHFVLAFGSGVSSETVAQWLYQKTAGRIHTLRIDGTEIEPSREGIEAAIQKGVGRICP
jgi:hypothetical protein